MNFNFASIIATYCFGKATLGEEPFPYFFDFVGFLNLLIVVYLLVPSALADPGRSGTNGLNLAFVHNIAVEELLFWAT